MVGPLPRRPSPATRCLPTQRPSVSSAPRPAPSSSPGAAMQGDSPAALQIRGPAASSDPFCDAAKSRTSVAGAKFGTQDWPRMASTRSRSAVCGVSILGWIWFSFPRLWGGGGFCRSHFPAASCYVPRPLLCRRSSAHAVDGTDRGVGGGEAVPLPHRPTGGGGHAAGIICGRRPRRAGGPPVGGPRRPHT